MEFACKTNAAPRDGSGFGLQLSEFRGQEDRDRAIPPMLVPFNAPETIFPLTYNYKSLPTTFPTYEARLDANFHMGIEGTLLDNTQTEIVNGVSVQLTLDPVKIAASTPQMGTTPGKHRVIIMWQQDTGPGSDDPLSQSHYAPNQRLVSLLGFEVEIGDNPIGPPPVQTVTVPNLVGMTQAAAESALFGAGLMSTVVTANSPTVTVGIVMSQAPLAGASVPAMTNVAITVSNGPAIVPPTPPVWEVVGQIMLNGVVTRELKRLKVPLPGTDRYALHDPVLQECVELIVGPDPGCD